MSMHGVVYTGYSYDDVEEAVEEETEEEAKAEAEEEETEGETEEEEKEEEENVRYRTSAPLSKMGLVTNLYI